MRQGLVVLMAMLLPVWVAAGELHQDQVERFLASMQELQAQDRYPEALAGIYRTDEHQALHPGSLLVSDMVSLLNDKPVHDTLEQVVRKHGFSGAEDWGRTGDRILLAVISLQMADLAPAMGQEIERLERDIRNNEHFSESQKTRMQAMLEDSSRLVERVSEVGDADRDAVKPWLEELGKVLTYHR